MSEDKYYKIERLEKEVKELKVRLREKEKGTFNSGKFIVRTVALRFGKPEKWGEVHYFLMKQKEAEEFAEALEKVKAKKGFADSAITSITPQADPSLCEHQFESDHYGNDHVDYYTCRYCGEKDER